MRWVIVHFVQLRIRWLPTQWTDNGGVMCHDATRYNNAAINSNKLDRFGTHWSGGDLWFTRTQQMHAHSMNIGAQMMLFTKPMHEYSKWPPSHFNSLYCLDRRRRNLGSGNAIRWFVGWFACHIGGVFPHRYLQSPSSGTQRYFYRAPNEHSDNPGPTLHWLYLCTEVRTAHRVISLIRCLRFVCHCTCQTNRNSIKMNIYSV